MAGLIDNLDLAIRKGTAYLIQHQFPNGEFCCYIGHEDHMKDTIPHSNVFPTSLICYSLLGLRQLPGVEQCLQLSATFLQFQSMRAGVWNNFTSWSPLFLLCPPDVDNTSCASIVLQFLNREYPDNKNILHLNRSNSGLFYSWYTFRHKMAWNKDYWLLCMRELKHPLKSLLFWYHVEAGRYDIDAAVNANVLFYLGLSDFTRPIVDYMLKIIEQGTEDNCDLWYRNPFTIYYFFSRNYSAGIRELEAIKSPIIDRIIAKVQDNGSLAGNALDTALGIISLIKLGYTSDVVDKAVAYLLNNQNEYGNWPRWAVYYGGPKKLQCYGSEEITTGFCLEALSLYQNLQHEVS